MEIENIERIFLRLICINNVYIMVKNIIEENGEIMLNFSLK